MQSGKFGHGFLSAGITKGAQVKGIIPNHAIKGTIASAILGDTVSKISGGKLANGAGTGAFQFLFNDCVSGGNCTLRDAERAGIKGRGNSWGLSPEDEESMNIRKRNAKVNTLTTSEAIELNHSPVTDPETLSFLQKLGCTMDGNGAYCSVVSPVIAISSNTATSIRTFAFMPQLAAGGSIVGGVSYLTTLCLCKFNVVTTVTG